MSRLAGLVIFVVAAIGCDQGGGGGGGSSGSGSGSGSAVAVAPAKNPGGGFSADLAKKLDSAGSGSDTPERTNNTTANAGGGGSDAAKPEDPKGSGDAKVAAGSGSAADPKAGSAVDPKAGSATAKVVEPPKPPDKAGSAVDSKAGSATAKVVEPPKPPDKAGSAVATKPPTTPTPPTPATTPVTTPVTTPATPAKPAVNTPAELKAINISLLPNWDRDVEAPGTISLAVKLPGKTEIATFVFRYGIEDAKAPADRDAYKKWLADNKLFTSKDDRQKGAAWYLEGVDGAGKPAFRMVVIYGGKKLICYGSLYKDSALGDLRDQTIIQAKQICETLTL